MVSTRMITGLSSAHVNKARYTGLRKLLWGDTYGGVGEFVFVAAFLLALFLDHEFFEIFPNTSYFVVVFFFQAQIRKKLNYVRFFDEKNISRKIVKNLSHIKL